MATDQSVRLAVLWDLDGVLANNAACMNGKDSYWRLTEAEWEDFHLQLPHCEVNEGWVSLLCLMHNSGHYNIIYTNRPESQRTMTEEWLARQELPYDLLSMRTDGDSHETSKRERLAEVMREFIVVLGIDDDPEVIAVYHRAGIPALYAHSGYHAGFTSQVAVH